MQSIPVLTVFTARPTTRATQPGMQLELEGMRKALHDRKLIERSKGILLRNAQIGEAAVFCRLQSIARASNRKMIDIASSILTAEQAYQTTDK